MFARHGHLKVCVLIAIALASIDGRAKVPTKGGRSTPPGAEMPGKSPSGWYYARGHEWPVYDHPHFVAFRHSRENAPDLLEGGRLIGTYSRSRIAVYHAPEGKDASRWHGAARKQGRKLGMDPMPCYRRRDGRVVIPTGELIVQFRPDLAPDEIQPFLERHGAVIVKARKRHRNQFVVSVDHPTNSLIAALEWSESDFVEWSEPNCLRQPHARFLPSDPLFTNQWSLHNTGQFGSMTNRDVNAEKAWDITRGNTNVIIAVLDNGFDLTHPDIASNVYVNPLEGTPGLDGDGNGYTNDLNGWDFNGNDNDPSAEAGDDHGTAALGPMIAVAENTRGVAGLAHGCRFLPVRVYADLIDADTEAEAIEYAADMADVISISYLIETNHVIVDALRYAATRGRGGLGTVVCTALGNQGSLRRYDWDLAAAPEVVSVSGITSFDRRSWFSDFGPALNVMAAAGGGYYDDTEMTHLGNLNLVSTDRQGGDGYNAGDYDTEWGGTSASAPFAAAVAALILDQHPDWTALEVRQQMEATCDKIDARAHPYNERGWNNKYGFGRVNAYAALTAPQPPWDTYESDDTSGAAGTIADGELQYRSLEPAGDEDWVVFTITNQTVVKLTAITSSNIALRLYRTNLAVVASGTTSLLTNLTADTYYGRAYMTNTTAVSQYGLHLAYLNMDDGYEPDDNLGQAKTIAPRTRHSHTFFPTGDVDFATFTLTRDAFVEIWTVVPDLGDTKLWLRDAGGNQIDYNDDYDKPNYYYNSYIGQTLTAGTYYIEVQEWYGDAWPSYEIYLEVYAPDPQEPDNAPTSATVIASGQRISYTLHSADDEDWLMFSLSNRANILVMTESINPFNVGDTFLTLYDGQTNQLAQNNDANNYYYSAIYRTGLDTGTYYIKVEGYERADSIATGANHYVALDIFESATAFTDIEGYGSMAMQWLGDASYTYEVEYLSNSVWTPATNLEGRIGPNAWTDDGSATSPDPESEDMRWYRLLAK